MYQKILVAYNGTAESRAALHECIRLAPGPDVQIHLLAVVNFPAGYMLAGEYVPEAALVEEQERMQTDLAEARALMAKEGMTVTDHLAVGEPVEVMSKLAAELGIELIILGHRRNKSMAARWWRGSVDVSLLEKVRCSLLIALDSGR
jgi:nucleotide-binding universal stress UspA family protein